MAAKNSIKKYASDSYYHLYNRGVEKRKIFLDEQDLSVYLSFLKTYLLPKNQEWIQNTLSNPSAGYLEKRKALQLANLNNFFGHISLHCHCLMPNHFHLLVHQKEENDIDNFMNSLCTRYTGYFNRKYKRVGKLFQGVYKAVLVETDSQLLHLSRYIHNNPRFLGKGAQPFTSTLPEYLGQRTTGWIKTDQILSYFNKQNPNNPYAKFVASDDIPKNITELVIDAEE